MGDLQNDLSPYRLIGPSADGEVEDLLLGKSVSAAKQRIQALISEWLRMENLVVLTGAGCSVSLGGKTMAGLDTATLSAVAGLPNVPAAIKAILDARLIDAILDEHNIGFEDWLSYLANAHHVSSEANSPFSGVKWKSGQEPTSADLRGLIDWVGKAIFAECALTLPEPPTKAPEAKKPDENEKPGDTQAVVAKIAPHLAFLAKLVARDSNLGRVHLFTLNYDTLFEQALELLGIQYFDGFTGRADARFDPSVYGLDVYYPGEIAEGRVRRFDKFLHFYKLHGSIHWHVTNGELRARHPALEQFAAYRDLKPDEKATALEALAAQVPSIGILPTANKFVQTLTMPFAHLFRSFQIRLTAPQTFLLVLGYGFGDDHVTRIIDTALMNPSLVMLVIEPNPNSPTLERIRRYKELGKRAFVLTPTADAFKAAPFQHATFDDFAKSLMPDVQWLNDFLRLRAFEKQIQSNTPPDEEKA